MTPPAIIISALFEPTPPVLTALEGRVTLLPLLAEAFVEAVLVPAVVDPVDPPRAWLQMVSAALVASTG